MASLIGKVMLMSILWASLGVAVGLAVRHQVAAIVGPLVWIMFVEMFMEGYAEHVVRFLPVHATTARLRRAPFTPLPHGHEDCVSSTPSRGDAPRDA
jgi:hypothetical protein